MLNENQVQDFAGRIATYFSHRNELTQGEDYFLYNGGFWPSNLDDILAGVLQGNDFVDPWAPVPEPEEVFDFTIDVDSDVEEEEEPIAFEYEEGFLTICVPAFIDGARPKIQVRKNPTRVDLGGGIERDIPERYVLTSANPVNIQVTDENIYFDIAATDIL